MKYIQPPKNFDWQHWVKRWERMQERYLVQRAERFDVMVRLISETQSSACRILDLGCGPGSLMLHLLEALPKAQVVGVDFDPAMLFLGRMRLAKYTDRARSIQANLREPTWAEAVHTLVPVDAIVSATALHWLGPEQLKVLYRQAAQLLRPGGIFLNADHVGSSFPPVQKAWEKHREEMRTEEGNSSADDWDGFWRAYGHALGVDMDEYHRSISDGWYGESVEEGMPLAWQFDALRANGFDAADCFWRCDCDAIYGGIRDSGEA